MAPMNVHYSTPQASRDQSDLQTLAVFYYVMAGLTALLSIFPLGYLGLGVFMLVLMGAAANDAASASPDDAAPHVMAMAMVGPGLFIVFSLLGVLGCLLGAYLQYLTGRMLVARRGYVFCMVSAVLHLFNFPLGAILGAFTIAVLARESIKAQFGRGRPEFVPAGAAAIPSLSRGSPAHWPAGKTPTPAALPDRRPLWKAYAVAGVISGLCAIVLLGLFAGYALLQLSLARAARPAPALPADSTGKGEIVPSWPAIPSELRDAEAADFSQDAESADAEPPPTTLAEVSEAATSRSLDDALADLKIDDAHQVAAALDWIGSAPVEASRREEVEAALERVSRIREAPLAERARKVCQHWGLDADDVLLQSAVAAIQSQDGFRKKDAAEWLSQVPLDPDRQAEIARALDLLIQTDAAFAAEPALKAAAIWADADSTPALLMALERPFQAMLAIKALLVQKDPRAVGPLVKLLHDPFETGEAACDALMAFPAEDVRPAVLPLMHEPHERVRTFSRRILERQGDGDDMYEQTRQDLLAGDALRRRAAMEWLTTCELTSERGPMTAAICQAIEPGTGLFEGVSTAALARWADKDQAPLLLALSKDADEGRRLVGLQALLAVDPPSATAPLAEILQSPAGFGRAMLVLRGGGEGAEQAVLPLLSHSDGEVQRHACMLLGQVGGDQSKSALERIRKRAESRGDVRLMVMAQAALRQIELGLGRQRAGM